MRNALRKLSLFIVGALLFTGVPMIAWGLNDVPGYFSNIHRTLYTALMTMATLLTVLFVPNQGRGSGEGVKLVARQKLTVLYLQIVSVLFVVLSPISDRRGLLALADEPAIRTIGLVLAFSGYFFMNWAIVVLGKQFSVNVTIQKDHELITKGPYRLIRHPRYLGIIFFFSGIALVFRSLLSAILVVMTVAALCWRIADEEKLMQDEFEGAWEDYKKRSWRLIPHIY